MLSSAEGLLSALRSGAWSKVPELRQRVLFTLGAVLVYRLGTYIPIPGVNENFMRELLDEHRHDALGLFDVFTGGAVGRFSLFTLNIAPYLTAAGLLKRATPLVPRLKELKDQGLAGSARLDRYAMCLAALIALVVAFQVSGALEGARNAAGAAVAYPGWRFRLTCMVSLVGGTLLLTWMGRQINARGIGPGFILVGTSGLVVNLPRAIRSLSGFGHGPGWSPYAAWLLLPLAVAAVTLIVFFELAQRRIPVGAAKRVVGNRMFGASGVALPLKANIAGMGPTVTATSILLMPATLVGYVGAGPTVRQFVEGPLARGQPLYLLLYAAAVIVIAFVSAPDFFDPVETADQFKKSSQFVPGVRPGEQTAAYLKQVRLRLVLPAALYLCVLCVPLELLIGRFGLPNDFSGAALVGMVTLVLGIIAHLASIAIRVSYEQGLLRRPQPSA